MIALLYILLISLAVLGTIRIMLPLDLKALLGPREFAAAILLPALATISPNYWLFAISVAGFVAITPASPEQRLRLMLFCLPLLPGFSLTLMATPSISLIQVNYTILLTLGFVLAAFGFLKRNGGSVGKRDIPALLIWTIFLFIAVRGASPGGVARGLIQSSLVILLPYFIVSRGFTAARQPALALLSLIFAAAIIATIATFESLRNWLLYAALDVGGDPASLSSYAKQRAGFLRASTTFGESTSQSLFLGLALVLLFALRAQLKRPTAFFLIFALLCSGLVFAFARVGMIVSFVGVMACLWIERRRLTAVVILLGAPMGWAVLVSIAKVVPVIGAALGLDVYVEDSVGYRSLLARRILEVWRDHPLFGINSADIPLYLEDLRQGEGIIDLVNGPLAIALQAGAFGFVLYCWAVVQGLLTSYRPTTPSEDDQRQNLRAATVSGLIAVNVGLLTTSLHGRNILWLVILLGLIAASALQGPRPTSPRQTISKDTPRRELFKNSFVTRN